jgi:hypothetical protein
MRLRMRSQRESAETAGTPRVWGHESASRHHVRKAFFEFGAGAVQIRFHGA